MSAVVDSRPRIVLRDGVRFKWLGPCRASPAVDGKRPDCEGQIRVAALDDHSIIYTHRGNAFVKLEEQACHAPDDGWRWKLGYYHGWKTLEEVEEEETLNRAMCRPEYSVFMREVHR